MKRKPKVLVLLSGGLDSSLVVKLMLDQGIGIEALNFSSPFCLCDRCHTLSLAKQCGIKLHTIAKGKDYLDIVRKPRHGYGSGMNPCLDCRIYILKKAKRFAKRIGADFIVTGEVLDERPFSQRRRAMMLIEKEAGLENKVVRPLSGKLLPPTEAEKKGLVSRENFLAIKGRSRKPQIRLAKKLGLKDYPCPAGGCLLTDSGFSKKLRDFLKHSKTLSWKDVELLKPGRHFRLGKGKIIVGRNEPENKKLLALAKKQKLAWMEVKDYMGPVTVLQGRTRDLARKAAEITVRYSDAPKKEVELELHKGKIKRIIRAKPITKKELERMRII